ncbi:MAG: type II toxin-antitoxin system VapC family toxin [Deltaproteobacteria bacterium]|nr:type II toxin-antitoxin system VapC family toxin [Deltaproteobacteria bacterium]
MPHPEFLYWDASAVISLLVADIHTSHARRALRPTAHHFVSSLGIAEVLAVLARAERLPQQRAFVQQVHEGFWHQTHLAPSLKSLAALARRHTLRGADLWHLGAALALRKELPGLVIITFDKSLAQAARHEAMLLSD